MWPSWARAQIQKFQSKNEGRSNLVGEVRRSDFDCVSSFSEAVISSMPILIPCFNNLTYVRGMIEQLRKLGIYNIILMDNGSTYPPFVDFINSLSGQIVIFGDGTNHGPHYIFNDPYALDRLPDLFCLTDPDLLFNDLLPRDFLSQMLKISRDYKIGKVGMALDISEPEMMTDGKFSIENKLYTVSDWEKQFWIDCVGQTEGGDPLYRALLDTTFALYNKEFFMREKCHDAIRVAGRFTCKHLPWYKDNGLPNDEIEWYRSRAKFSFYMSESVVEGHG